jgi:hypothetical protein
MITHKNNTKFENKNSKTFENTPTLNDKYFSI